MHVCYLHWNLTILNISFYSDIKSSYFSHLLLYCIVWFIMFYQSNKKCQTKQMNIIFWFATTSWHILLIASAQVHFCCLPGRSSWTWIRGNLWQPGQQLTLSARECCLSWIFFAVQGNEEEGAGREENGYLYLLAPELPDSDPGRISNTMFYKLMFLEVGLGYLQPRRKRRTSSVSPEGSDPDTVLLEAALTPPVSDFTKSWYVQPDTRAESISPSVPCWIPSRNYSNVM